MSTARGDLDVAVLDGFLYAIGGRSLSGPISSVERYSPSTNKWESVASMNRRRDRPCAAILNGKIYVIGGSLDNQNGNSVGFYDPKRNTWKMVMRFIIVIIIIIIIY